MREHRGAVHAEGGVDPLRRLARTVLTARQWQELAQASGRAMDRLYDAVSRLTMCLGDHVANANP